MFTLIFANAFLLILPLSLLLLRYVNAGNINLENSGETLSVKKCCELDEAYDVDTRQCFKLAKHDDFVFEPYDYLRDILSMVDVDYNYDELEFPSNYNISAIGKPYCKSNESDEYVSFNIPVDPDQEPTDDEFGAHDSFRIEFPSHKLFEISQYKFHQDYCVDLAYRYDQYWAVAALFCKQKLSVICKEKNCVRFCCPPSEIGLIDRDILVANFSSAPKLPHRCGISDEADADKSFPVFQDNYNLRYIYGVPECFKSEDLGYTSYILEENEVVKNKNGKIKIGTGYFDYENACVLQTKFTNKNSNITKYSTQINICKPKDVYEQGYLSWVRLVDFQIIPGILIVSTIFLGMLFIYEWRNNRDKLFSCLRICVIFMYFIATGNCCLQEIML